MTSMWGEAPRPLACPGCLATSLKAAGGALVCAACAARWPVSEGLPRLYREAGVQGTDKLMRVIYDSLPALHDPATRLLTPLMQGVSEARMRAGYIGRLKLGGLSRPEGGGPIRILEVGVGAGANLPLLKAALPVGVPVEVWGADLSLGMLRQCQRRLRRGGLPPTRLLMADAHALPFEGASFDRVFHIGAMGSYRDPALALAEMARVARPGTPIVVVDEQLDPDRRHTLYHRAWFKALTFYDDDPHCPTESIPSGAIEVRQDAISRFYYCLSFEMPQGAPEPVGSAPT